jgi:hypothetical protein
MEVGPGLEEPERGMQWCGCGLGYTVDEKNHLWVSSVHKRPHFSGKETEA